MKKYIIIGNGIAGTTAAEEIRKHDSDGEINLITNESLPLYSRIRLPDFISGKAGEKELIIKDNNWHDKNRIKLITQVEVQSVDFESKKVFTNSSDMKPITFDSLLLAVGSNSFIPPVKGSNFGGVTSLRTINDAKSIIKKISINSKNLTDINNNKATINKIKKEVVVIGGGLLGLEVAAAIINVGIKVTVVEFCDRLLPRQLDYKGAKLLQTFLENMGFIFRLGEATDEIIGQVSDNAQKVASVLKGLKLKPQIQCVKLKSGDVIKADTLLFSTGVRPNLSLVQNSEIKIDKGIIVNQRMETSVPSIYAAGDVAEYKGCNFCIWQEAMEQGRVAGINMAGGSAEYKNITPANMLKVAGIKVASAGDIDVDEKMDSEVISTESIYKKIVKDKDGKIVGCIMVGDTTDFNQIVKDIKGD